MEKLKRIKLRSVNNDENTVENMHLENFHTERNVTFDKFRNFLLHPKVTKNKKSDLEFDSATVDCAVKVENSLSDNEFGRRSHTSSIRRSFHSLRNSIRAKCGQRLRRSLSRNKGSSTDHNNNNSSADNNNNKQKSIWNITGGNNSGDDSVHCNKFSRTKNDCHCDGEYFVNSR